MARTRPLPLALAAVAAALALVPAQAAAAADYVRDEVVVTHRDGTSSTVKVPASETVDETIARLSKRKDVRSADRDWIAKASFVPNDPGRGSGWDKVQWNLASPIAGINAPLAWDHLIAAGRPGGAGVLVAVLDTGVAYRNLGRYKRSPDLNPKRFRKGHDFVDKDPYPLDENGHGTHVASTIAEQANNRRALTGIAYGATILPVRVLDSAGEGRSSAIARGIRFATDKGASIINLSFEFGPTVLGSDIPSILSALRYAHRHGVLVVGAAGNSASAGVAYPARSDSVLAVGAVTEHGCLADYSNEGTGLDLVAPGGGDDSELAGDPNCRPAEPAGSDIYQMTYTGRSRAVFGLPSGYVGTSMAAPHVSATAALIIASGVLGPDPSPDAVERRLLTTTRDLGPPGPDEHYGAGLIDAAKATDPAVPVT